MPVSPRISPNYKSGVRSFPLLQRILYTKGEIPGYPLIFHRLIRKEEKPLFSCIQIQLLNYFILVNFHSLIKNIIKFNKIYTPQISLFPLSPRHIWLEIQFTPKNL